MLINKSNYEFFALDYIEGNLDARKRKAMKAFLQAHPDLEAEIESMQAEMFTFEAKGSIVYENKANLLKEENETPVVFMQPRRWYQMAAAAAIAILLIGFGVGYFAGSVSTTEGGMMVEKTPIIEEKISPTAPVIVEKETIAEATDNELIVSNEATSKIKEKNLKKPSITQVPTTSTLATLESENIEKVEPNPIEVKPILEELEIIERAEIVVVNPLPKLEVNITINSIQSNPEPTVIMTSDSKDLIASLNDSRFGNRLSKIKNFLGKLPFEDATLDAFVPTYFANAD